MDIAKEKCDKTDKLVYDLQGVFKVVEDQIEFLRDTLKHNYKTSANIEGLFSQRPSDFDSCIKFDSERLNQLLTNEKAKCQDNLMKEEERTEKARQGLMEIVEQQ